MKKIILFSLILQTLLLSKNENIEKYGDIVQIMIPTIAYATTYYVDDKEGRNEFYKSFFATFGTTHLLKRTVKEERPNGNNTQSFPSGHTSASFQGATFIHNRYGLKYAILPYLGASFVGYSRVYADQHYTHDVLAGALIGSGFSYYFSSPYKYKNINISPVVYSSAGSQSNIYGLKVIW